MRIQKYISETGFCSRRHTNRLIIEGRVTVNGVVSDKNTMIAEHDEVLIDGRPIPRKEQSVYLALHKPVGITCTAAKEVEGNIIDFVNYPTRIFPVGRLDKASEGLILMTNDGDIFNKILRSEHGHEKEYVVTVDKVITEQFVLEMESGVEILNTITKPCKVEKISDNVFKIILTQGLNRQIRRMCKALGYRVERLQRIRIMNIHLGNLEAGAWRELSQQELNELLKELQ
ncbi:pseudouridine synthase [Priestia flexa]|uniref:Pseudouridine synthase n=1 Tax=Priestia veravalensis TaxID=1414648 RepID=A0A0V8JJQ5_9BACI|nr:MULTISPECIES: pseudouridine synthase [Priestia]KSU87176.1 23S rRNA pseudouridine synthase F [Priestia veravalensis]MCA1202899.1 pseudouridine synthase [Priestia flexa]MCP1187846.1 pseudouridine synthase [Priestia flexa]SCC41493.1 23S rRNA pseudouridine2604 synthase [Priestia flexa]